MTEQIKRNQKDLRKMAVDIWFLKKVAKRFDIPYHRCHQDKYNDFFIQLGSYGVYCADAVSQDHWQVCAVSDFPGSKDEPPSSDISDIATFNSFNMACDNIIKLSMQEILQSFLSDEGLWRDWKDNQHFWANNERECKNE